MQTFQELMTSALTDAGYSDEQVTAALQKIYTHEKLGPRLNSLVKTATEDYNAQVGRVKQFQDWYAQARPEYDRMAAEYARAVQEIEQMRANPNGGAPPFDASKYVSKEDLVALQVDMGRRYASVIKDTAGITSRHVNRFHEDPDFAAIDKIATEQNLPLTAAYEQWIAPKVKEQEKAANEEWKKQQREEIERDVRSRYNLPVETAPPEVSPLYRKANEADLPKDMDAELLNTWRSVPAKA